MVQINGAITFPEDEGTGLEVSEEPDWVSAGHFAGLHANPEMSDFVAQGMEFQNVSDGSFDIDGGIAFVYHDETVQVQDEDGNYTRDWTQGTSFAVHAETTTGISYSVGNQNYVYIDLSLSTNNTVTYELQTTDTPPSSPSLKIGEIDSSGNAMHVNRQSPVSDAIDVVSDEVDTKVDEDGARNAVDGSSLDQLNINNEFNIPVYQTESDLPAGSEGDIAYVIETDELYSFGGS